MSYYNPKIYNYSNLKPEDKTIIRAMVWMVDSLQSIGDDYLLTEEESTLEKIKCEIALETILDAKEKLTFEIIEHIVAFIDDYEEEIEPIETDNYLYGIDQ